MWSQIETVMMTKSKLREIKLLVVMDEKETGIGTTTDQSKSNEGPEEVVQEVHLQVGIFIDHQLNAS